MNTYYDLIVIGAGAAGLFASVNAAMRGCRVLVLDHCELPGKKLLVTGNGRCNYTNLVQDPSACRCGDPAFVTRAYQQFDEKQTLDFFERELFLYTVSRNGYCYPRSNQARSVRNALLSACERWRVEIRSSAVVKEILPEKSRKGGRKASPDLSRNGSASEGIRVRTESGEFRTRSCLLATGGKSFPKTGSDGSGYAIAKRLGHTLLDPLPALVPLVCEGRWLKLTEGVRIRAGIRLSTGVPKAGTGSGSAAEKATDKAFSRVWKEDGMSDTGEIQMTAYGISGIPVFNVSRYAARALKEGAKVSAHLDFLPEYSEKEAGELLKAACLQKNVEAALGGLFPDKVVRLLLRIAGKDPQKLLPVAKDYTLVVKGTKDFDQAQVTTGGISVREVDPETMESRLHPGILFAGEILDVDAVCGGYNLQWAWTSAWIAARTASERMKSCR